MSADNFVVIRKFPEGYRWGNFFASEEIEGPYSDDSFHSKTFPTMLEAMEDAVEGLGIIEYGFYADNKPEEG